MHISTRGRYALRAMVELAAYASRPVRRQEIALRQAISANYIAQLFRPLREADLVRSIKGPGGGYMLARDPSEISVGDVLRAVEGPLAVAECLVAQDAMQCERAATCSVRPFWQRLTGALEEIVDSTSLQDLCHPATVLDGEGT
jgi:Rrf2 family cysteine metabolism transcriptional repressor